jgi:hypothetical protein
MRPSLAVPSLAPAGPAAGGKLVPACPFEGTEGEVERAQHRRWPARTHETASPSATDAAAPSWIQRSKQRAKPAPSVQPAPRMRLKATLGAGTGKRHAQPGRSRIELVGCLPRRPLEKSQRAPRSAAGMPTPASTQRANAVKPVETIDQWAAARVTPAPQA